ncbi:hypothetical protein EUGRSUZ_C04114 [Eucalyptus grandis]|uniref:Uncharacterized protein n=2 Tax=Eucalyptus grandis TaxID=71139 RepID=A0ACC3LML7_EUCGR|nr:hypothetical protein EUGRSUZ_C04114 [Eucalyptus grandis]
MYATKRGARLLNLTVLLDKFFDVEYHDCVKALDAYASAAKQIDELIASYNWCKDTGVARSSEYPEVQRLASKLLETLNEFEEEPVPDMNEIKALPPPENYTPAPPPEPPKPQLMEDLVDLRDNGVTADDQGNNFAFSLFAGPLANTGNGSWEAFPSNGEPEVTSAWQTPAAESGKEDWELALVETASNLSKQKAALGSGLDPLLLNGMYDQGMVRQHVSTAQLTGGNASNVALPGLGKRATPDPFAASLSIPPPSYVQMAKMKKKQHLVIGGTGYCAPGPPVMPYGMPPVKGMGPPTGYYYSPY